MSSLMYASGVAAAVILVVSMAWIKHRKSHALHDAAAAGNTDRIRALIATGTPVDTIYDHVSPLHVAVMRNENDAARCLLEAGASVNLKTASDLLVTPLHMAATTGNVDMAEILLSHGADVHARASNDEPPVLTAARFRHSDLVKRLLAHGADPVGTDARGNSLLFTCIMANEPEAAAILIDAGMNPNGMDKDRQAHALHAAMVFAIHSGDPAMVECLLAHGADPNVKDHHGMTPLKMAKLSKKEPLMTLLISHGAQA